MRFSRNKFSNRLSFCVDDKLMANIERYMENTNCDNISVCLRNILKEFFR